MVRSTSVLNQKFMASSSCGCVVLAEAFDRSQDVVGRFGPAEGLWIGIVVIDEGGDVSAQRDHAAIDSPPDPAFGDESEEALDPRLRVWSREVGEMESVHVEA